MAAPGLSAADQARVRAVFAETGTVAETARRLNLNRTTVAKYAKEGAAAPVANPPPFVPPCHMPAPAPEAGGPTLPPSLAKPLKHIQVDAPGWWLVLGDTHFP